MKIATTAVLAVVYTLTFLVRSVGAVESPSSVDFQQKIRPILSEHCFACHGPDEASREADLRLDQIGSVVELGAIVPGNPGESELVSRIRTKDPDAVMPPADFGKPLSEEQKDLLEHWIAAGAPWQEHWSFVAPQKAPLPHHDGVQQWARNSIDYFVYAKIRELGFSPEGESDRSTLARRVALDSTGLPPDPTLLETFLVREDPKAYAEYVDDLLNSPHAGEHRARFWLDAARYGDTHGMHVDNYREIWPYRDWVIRAFNTNMPFDQFVVEQIAGDLLPEATLEQHIATGFNRCNITTSEGGAIPEELDVRYMVDRVETTATVFLGLTAGCAVCHDHKYDPISQREFYQLGAFFNNTTQPAMDGNQPDTPPVVVIPREDFHEEWFQLQAQRRQLRAALNQATQSVEPWWSGHPKALEHPVPTDDLLVWLPFAQGEDDTFQLAETDSWADDHPAGKRGIRFGASSEAEVELPQLRTDEPFSISFWVRTPDKVINTTLLEQMGESKEGKAIGWTLTLGTQGTLKLLMHDGLGNAITGKLPDNDALRPRSWQHVCVRYSGGTANSSFSILANGHRVAMRNASQKLFDQIEACDLVDGPMKIAPNAATCGISDLRVFRRWLSDAETRLLYEHHTLRKLLASDTGWHDMSASERELIAICFQYTQDATFRETSFQLAGTETRRDFIYAHSTTTSVMQERASPPRAWILQRGEYTKRGEEVSPNVPEVFPPLPDGDSQNRLSLAQWLVSPEHPLTARVKVNRLWQSVFGVGLVKTSEDFGVMGDRPTHPELLDWLAVEFIDSGWDVNHLLHLILTSATYRQASHVTPAKLVADPDNRYFTRGPRVRLDAEVLRDQALAVSQLLRRDIGGPSVKPYQPKGLWKVVAITGSNTKEFQQDSGGALYRRSLYTFWKRTSPPPSMAAFNAPTREQCTVRRERTNTPLQALVMMNDVQYVEAARHLAQWTLQHASDNSQRASWMVRRALSRPASDQEVKELASAASAFSARFAENQEAVQKLIAVGESSPDATLDPVELGAWTMVANTIMNTDEFINR